ncbi:MAG: substrate-binding domain-containing protein [Massilia sp.]
MAGAQVRQTWTGPTTGPPSQAGKRVTFISQDFKNGGITAAYRGFFTASQALGWSVQLVDGKNDTTIISHALADAIRTQQHAVVIGGFDASQYADILAKARSRHIVVAGWHAAGEPGPTKDLFVNVSSSSSDVASLAAEYTINSEAGKIGVVIFNDDRFAVANAKTLAIKRIIEACERCTVLSVENVSISNVRTVVPQLVPQLNHAFGKAWTHTLAINDVYFDAINVPLVMIKRADIRNISAGDGSSVALSRIRSNASQQVATVAEASQLQGWQLADELNRAFAGQAPSGYVSKPILVTGKRLLALRGAEIDSDIPYKQAYLKIWKGDQLQDTP